MNETPKKKRKLLWCAHANIQTGFGRVTQNVLKYLSSEWDVAVIGIGYDGDPHGQPFRIYPAGSRGHEWGLNRLGDIYQKEKPDVCAFLMEPWNIMEYVKILRAELGSKVKILSYAVVDGLNMKGEHAHWLSQCDVTVFPTDFAVAEAKKAGYHGYGFVIPHGVDPSIYKPCDPQWARKQIGLNNLVDTDTFVFGNVNMNQPRKRIDLSIEAFAKFLELADHPKEPLLYLHLKKDTPEGWDIGNLASFFNVKQRISVMAEEAPGLEENMRYVYNSLDAQISTTSGEGWGLSTIEGMACGIAQILPDFAALGEWAKPAAMMIPAPDRSIMSKQQNVVRYTPTVDDMAEAMLMLYKDAPLRKMLGKAARKHALQPYFRWSTIAAGFDEALRKAIESEGVSGKFLVQAEAKAQQVGPSGAPIAQEQR